MSTAAKFPVERCERPEVYRSGGQRHVMLSLLRMEERDRWFDERVAGTYFWELVRLPIYFELVRKLGLLEIGPTRRPWSPADLAHVACSTVRGTLWKNPLFAGARPLLVDGYSRRQVAGDGRWHDVHFDTWLSELDVPFVYLRRRNGRRHYGRIPTRNVYDHDVLDVLASIAVRSRASARTPVDDEVTARIGRSLEKEFGVRVAAGELIRDIVTRHVGLRTCYDRLLARLKPRLVIVTSPNHPQMALIEAAKARGIRTAELQHGLFGPFDPSYTFPKDAGPIRRMADDLLVYGEYWRDLLIGLPDSVRTHVVGFPLFDRRRATVDRRPSESDSARPLVFFSQPTIGAALSKFAVELSRREGFLNRVVYRLHPDEADWRNRYPWLTTPGVTVDDGCRNSCYELLRDAEAQFGVYSTALLEGLALGVPTYLVDLPGIDMMEEAIARGWARIVREPDEVQAAAMPFETPPMKLRAAIFRPDAAVALGDYVRNIIQDDRRPVKRAS